MWNKTGLRAIGAAALLAGTLGTGTALAGNLEPSDINLGNTSFFDGFGPSHPGWTYLGYYRYSRVNSIKNDSGNDSSLVVGPKVNAFALVNQLIYATDHTFFDGRARLGFMGALPLVHIDASVAPDSPATLSSNSGVGDLTLGAFLQFTPIFKNDRPIYSQRFELDISAPTGRYNSSEKLNPGTNTWKVMPYWSATWLPTPKTEVSWRLNYLYNSSNTDTGLPETSKDQAGQAAWINFTTSYAVKSNLNVGINGYFFQQITNDSYTSKIPNIAELSGDTGKARVFGIGPGIHWQADKRNIWNLNVYDQIDVRNHSSGATINLHWIHSI